MVEAGESVGLKQREEIMLSKPEADEVLTPNTITIIITNINHLEFADNDDHDFVVQLE